MTQSDHPHRQDDVDQVDQALDALMRGDHSGLDELPPVMAATVSRLMWLAHECSAADETLQPNADSGNPPVSDLPVPRRPTSVPRPATSSGTPSTVPVSRRTQRATGSSTEQAGTVNNLRESDSRRLRGMNTLMRVAAVLTVLLLMGGAAFGLVNLVGDPDPGHTGSDPTQATHPQQLQPGFCSADIQPPTREAALSILRDIDADRDEAVRRSIVWVPIELGDGEVQRVDDLFFRWQSCRRFGSTYQAMTLQAPYFTREDFYGESTLDFRGPIETAYSDATLNEMLDRREELDRTSRQYWENAGTFPGMEETLTLGGEAFGTEDSQFIAVRALTWQMSTNEWQPSTTVVVYQWSGEEYLLFDIVSTPQGMPPYVYGAP